MEKKRGAGGGHTDGWTDGRLEGRRFFRVRGGWVGLGWVRLALTPSCCRSPPAARPAGNQSPGELQGCRVSATLAVGDKRGRWRLVLASSAH